MHQIRKIKRESLNMTGLIYPTESFGGNTIEGHGVICEHGQVNCPKLKHRGFVSSNRWKNIDGFPQEV